MRRYWYLVLIVALAFTLLVGSFLGCDDDDDDNDAGDDDLGDDDVGDDDVGDDDVGDDDVGDDDVGDDDVTDDDVTDDDVTDDDITDDDTGDDDTGDDDVVYPNEDQMIVNGDFETGDISPWVGDWGGGIVYHRDDTTPHSGDYSVWLGGRSNVTEWIAQMVSVPAQTEDAEIVFWYKKYRVSSATGGFTASVHDATNSITLFEMMHVPDSEFTPLSGGWEEIVFNLSPAEVALIAGQNVLLHFNLVTQGGFLANLNVFLDDVTFTAYW